VSHQFTISEIPGGFTAEPFDVGALELKLAKRLKVGDVAPDFEITTLDDKPLRLSEYRGKYVLLDFWATWCLPCRAEIPHLKQTYEKFGGRENFELISLSVDSERDAAKKFVAEQGCPWPQGFLGNMSDSPVAATYGVRGIPAILLLGPDGKVIAKDLRGAAIQDAIAKALRSEPNGPRPNP
jgi:thiol-disulfide isomerase/thioredoxin